MTTEHLLHVRDLKAGFEVEGKILTAVDGISFSIPYAGSLGIAGESGCGKSVSAMSLVGLLPQPAGRITGGTAEFHGKNLLSASPTELSKIRGRDIGVIFQEPMTALNPVKRVGHQISEVFLQHLEISKPEAWNRSVEIMRKVRIPSPEIRALDYPHLLSGGMRQRIVIALALALSPSLIIADEPTTALDVTVQAQILKLMADMRRDHNSAMILISHDLGVIADTCDDLMVMYAGRIVEKGPSHQLLNNPRHAYTKGLLGSMPKLDRPNKSNLPVIPGRVASIADFVSGCRFCQRLDRTGETLQHRPPYEQITQGHWVENCPRCVE